MNSTIGERIKLRRVELGMSQEELAIRLGYRSRSSVNKIEMESRNLTQSRIKAIADALNTTPAYIMGWDEPTFPSNLTPLTKMDRIPLVGQIACGTPILAEQNIEEYIDLPNHIDADFALTCKGDSMIGAGISDGDVVYIRQQDVVENGQIAAVVIDEEATLKRFYWDGSTLMLVAENPSFAPMSFSGKDIDSARVVGRAVAYTHVIA